MGTEGALGQIPMDFRGVALASHLADMFKNCLPTVPFCVDLGVARLEIRQLWAAGIWL